MNKFDEMKVAIREAEATVKAADSIADDMARILRGRLRTVHGWNLRALKRELADFNANTREWKNEKA